MNKISVHELKKVLDGELDQVVLDVRTPVEYRSSSISSVKNIPLNDLSEEVLSDFVSKNEKVYLLCQSGARSQKAFQTLESLGYSDLVFVDGGMSAWNDAGYSVIEGKGAMSIERQVRVAAGSLVVLGVILSLLCHIYFIGISAFVGAGLIFAGVTDTCGMGLMLARMPWNR
jgi:rhodanese-related sulfurtransferase